MQLYGFLSKDDLEMFRLLLNVNGIGPKAALGVLAGLTADELRFAVLSDDIKTISKAKTTKLTVKKLKAKKTYYFKVRAYKKNGKQKLFGTYSKVLRVKM